MAFERRRSQQITSALVALAVLVLLLVVGAILTWRSRSTSTAARQQTSAGPLIKVSIWIEPPPSDYDIAIVEAQSALDNYLSAVALRDLARRQALVDEARVQLEKAIALEEAAQANLTTDASAAPEAENKQE